MHLTRAPIRHDALELPLAMIRKLGPRGQEAVPFLKMRDKIKRRIVRIAIAWDESTSAAYATRVRVHVDGVLNAERTIDNVLMRLGRVERGRLAHVIAILVGEQLAERVDVAECERDCLLERRRCDLLREVVRVAHRRHVHCWLSVHTPNCGWNLYLKQNKKTKLKHV